MSGFFGDLVTLTGVLRLFAMSRFNVGMRGVVSRRFGALARGVGSAEQKAPHAGGRDVTPTLTR